MSDSYYFDKRRLKRTFGKYAIIFLISFIPMILFNIYVGALISQNWVVILLDCVILLIFVCIGNLIANKIFARKDAKLEARRRERDELDKRKQQILEESYRLKREEKKKQKELKLVESEKIDNSQEPQSEIKSEHTKAKTSKRRK